MDRAELQAAIAAAQEFDPYNYDDAEYALAHPGELFDGYAPTSDDLAICRSTVRSFEARALAASAPSTEKVRIPNGTAIEIASLGWVGLVVDRRLAIYEVFSGVVRIGRVYQVESRHTHAARSGNVAVGYSYSKDWVADREANETITSGPFGRNAIASARKRDEAAIRLAEVANLSIDDEEASR